MFSNKVKVFQFLRFCTVGLANMAVDFTGFFLLMLVDVPYLLAQVIAYSAGVVNSFFFNRKWTFGITGTINLSEVAKFITVNGMSLLVSSGLLFILHDVNQLHLWLSKITATGGGIVINFVGSRLWVFTEK